MGRQREKPEKTAEKKETVKQAEEKGIKIKGIDDIMFHRSKCCYPLPGEQVAGFVTRGKGVSIHTINCPTLETHAIDRDRLVDVEWSGNGETTYTVKIVAYTVDKPGLLAEISAILSINNINIHHIDSSTAQGKQAKINLILEVKDKKQLDAVISKMSQIKGVLDVKRVKAK